MNMSENLCTYFLLECHIIINKKTCFITIVLNLINFCVSLFLLFLYLIINVLLIWISGAVVDYWDYRYKRVQVRVLSLSQTGFVTPTQSDDD